MSESQKQKPPPRPPPPLPPKPRPSLKCDRCWSEGKGTTHQLYHLQILRRFCTSCVLLQHPSLFCPVCFLFSDSPAMSHRFKCTKCSSLTHAHCLSPSPAAAAGDPFLCPPCASPSRSYFDAGPLEGRRHALHVLCAARISAASMARALDVQRAVVESRVGAAAVASKLARDAIHRLDC